MFQNRKNSVKKFIPPPPPLSPKDPELKLMIVTVRKRFLEDAENNKHLYIEDDLKRVKDDDFPVRRCIYGCKLNLEDAFEMLRNVMRWRKEIGFEGGSPTRFPLEFYKIGAIFPYEADREGSPLLYIRFKIHKKLDIIAEAIKKFVVYNMDLLDRQMNVERSWGIVFDAQGATLSNVDFEMLIFLVKTVKQYYSWGLKYIIVYEIPWYLEGMWKIAFMLIPEEGRRLFRLMNKNNITDAISKENLPDFMGGTCTRNYKSIPEGAKSAEEIGKLEMNFEPEEVQRLKAHFKDFLWDEY